MRTIIRRLIVWALGGEPLIARDAPVHDAAGVDNLASNGG